MTSFLFCLGDVTIKNVTITDAQLQEIASGISIGIIVGVGLALVAVFFALWADGQDRKK